MNLEFGKWCSYKVCSSCKKQLSNHQIYYNYGLCPHCGIMSGSTITKTVSIVYRKVYKIEPGILGKIKHWWKPQYTIEYK